MNSRPEADNKSAGEGIPASFKNRRIDFAAPLSVSFLRWFSKISRHFSGLYKITRPQQNSRHFLFK
jgi:hypothetical protein